MATDPTSTRRTLGAVRRDRTRKPTPINPHHKVDDVLLADGWHHVESETFSESLTLGGYEFQLNEADDTGYGWTITGPMTSVLALRSH